MPIDIQIHNIFVSFQKGEERGFKHYFNELYTPLQYFATNILLDEDLAEDIVEDCFIKLWYNREKIESPLAIKSYLYTSVRNACMDVKRREKVLQAHKSHVMNAPEEVEQPIVHQIIRAETIREIHRAIELLPPKMKEVFKMIFVEGKNYQEVAAILGITVEGVRSQKSKAIALLQQKLPPHLFHLLVLHCCSLEMYS